MALPGNLTTTGIGSLPHKNTAEAADFVLSEGPDMPFWPQLPRRSPKEKMIPQYAHAIPCVRWEETKNDVVMDASDKYSELEAFYNSYLDDDQGHFALSPDHAAGFYAFKEALKAKDRRPLLKGQITGPLTLTTGISDSSGKTLYSDPELRDAAVKFLTRNACWQIGQLQQLGTEQPIIFADEPVLAAYGSSAYVGISEKDVLEMLSQIFSAVADCGAIPGMHICGNSDWDLAMRSGVKILNFDAYQYGSTLALYARDLQSFLDRGGLIAWGIVPTTEHIGNETAASLTQRFDASLDALEAKGIDRGHVIRHSMLTPSCGAGSLNEQQAGEVFSLLKALKKELQGRISGTNQKTPDGSDPVYYAEK